jgi:hypothetical protein
VKTMNEQAQPSMSITDQILDNLFSSLENQDGFDNDLIEQLRNMSKRAELTKSVKVGAVLKTTQGEHDEAH